LAITNPPCSAVSLR